LGAREEDSSADPVKNKDQEIKRLRRRLAEMEGKSVALEDRASVLTSSSNFSGMVQNLLAQVRTLSAEDSALATEDPFDAAEKSASLLGGDGSTVGKAKTVQVSRSVSPCAPCGSGGDGSVVDKVKTVQVSRSVSPCGSAIQARVGTSMASEASLTSGVPTTCSITGVAVEKTKALSDAKKVAKGIKVRVQVQRCSADKGPSAASQAGVQSSASGGGCTSLRSPSRLAVPAPV